MRVVKQSTARDILVFLVASSDHITGLASATLTITASKAGAAFASITPTVTDRGSGWYKLALDSTMTNTLGDLALHITATSADPIDTVMQVVKYDFEDSVRLGLTALPNAAAEAAGGLYTRGSGAGQINQTNAGRVDTDVQSIAANVITATSIAANALTAAKIATDAITSSQIADNTITAAKIATDAITAAKIAANAITAAKIATDAITTAQLADGTITAAKIASSAITAAKIAADAITTTQLADGTITAAKIATDAITAAKIATDAITAAKIASNAITAAKIATDAITTAQLADGTITAAKLAADAITAAKVADDVSTEIATKILGSTFYGSITVAEGLRGILDSNAGRTSGFGTGTILIKSQDGSKTRFTITVDSTGRTAVTVGDLS